MFTTRRRFNASAERRTPRTRASLRRLPSSLMLAAGSLLALAAAAPAATFTVTNNLGDNKPLPGSLLQAVNDANDNGNPGTIDRINFDLPLSGGDTITTPGGGFFISEPVAINGCSEDPNHAGPCVGVRTSDHDFSESGIDATARDVTVRGLALTNWGSAAISGEATGLRVQNNWFGTKLDGAAEANEFGVRLFRSDSARVGGASGATGSAPATRNVFSDNTRVGLRITGDDDTRIQGNWFGTDPAGNPSANGNGENIELAADSDSGDRPIGTLIGGRVSAAQAATPLCDGPCNIIGHAQGGDNGDNGIDLQGGAEVGAAGRTTIAGNFIGLNGDCLCGNAGSGINVGEADKVTIGGPKRGDRNFVGRNDTGISASAGSNGLTIQNNFLGVRPLENSQVAAAPDETLAVVMAGGRFLDNRLAGTADQPSAGGLRLVPGSPSIVRGNRIGVGPDPLGLPGAGINALSDDNRIGGTRPGQRNLVVQMSGPFSTAIAVGGDRNRVLGNLIGTDASGADLANDNVGIGVGGDGNRIGGGSRASENVVSNSGSHAIVLAGDGADNNLIARNRGRANVGLFIDLDPYSGFGNHPDMGPNSGVQEPEVTRARTERAAGKALPGATVRVFRTAQQSGRIDRFLGLATANGAGRWSLRYPAPIPAGQYVTATQTPAGTQDTSEFAPAEIVSE